MLNAPTSVFVCMYVCPAELGFGQASQNYWWNKLLLQGNTHVTLGAILCLKYQIYQPKERLSQIVAMRRLCKNHDTKPAVVSVQRTQHQIANDVLSELAVLLCTDNGKVGAFHWGPAHIISMSCSSHKCTHSTLQGHINLTLWDMRPIIQMFSKS